MIEPISWLTAIGLLLYLMILGLKWGTKVHDDKATLIYEEDKKIDDCNNADDVIVEFDRLRQQPSNRP